MRYVLSTQQFYKYLLNNYHAQGSENVEIQEAQTHSLRTSQYLGRQIQKEIWHIVVRTLTGTCMKFQGNTKNWCIIESQGKNSQMRICVSDETDQMSHLDHSDFNKAFERVPNIFMVEMSMWTGYFVFVEFLADKSFLPNTTG